MARYRLYHPTSKEAVKISLLFEHGLERGTHSITADVILNSNYAEYSECIVSIPSELRPVLYETAYGDTLFALDGMQPECRYPVIYRGGKPYMEILDIPEDRVSQPVLYRFPVKFPK